MPKKPKIEDPQSFPTAPSPAYQKLFDQIAIIDTIPVENWKPLDVLAYFCRRYQDYYKTPYPFKFNNSAPSKAFEMFQLNVLILTTDKSPIILKKYIDFAFETRVKTAKRKLTSISFLNKPELLKEFKDDYWYAVEKSEESITRSKALPENFKLLFKDFSISTYGDLAFLNQMNPKPANLVEAFKALEDTGFDLTKLKKVV